jgi:glycerol-3-phosphate O-acyltransferase
VPLVAAALMAKPADRAALLAEMTRLVDVLHAAGAVLKLPPQGVERAMEEGLTPLLRRCLVTKDLRAAAESAAILAFYAAPVWQALSVEAGNAAMPQT